MPEAFPAAVVVCLLPSSLAPAERAAGALGARVDLRGRDFGNVGDHLRGLFAAGASIVGLMSGAIMIRALAPLLADKRVEPPVVALTDAGLPVPLLGGHRGANALARRLAETFGTRAAVTTAGETRLGVALDEPPEGWTIETPECAKAAMAGLLEGRSATISGEAPWLAPLLDSPEVSTVAGDGAYVVLAVEGQEPLIYRRRHVMLGVGTSRGCPPDELIGLAARTLADHGIAEGEVAAVHSIDIKSDEAAVHALARHLGAPARFHGARDLAAEERRLASPSEAVRSEVGVPGVAEAACLRAAGPGAELLIAKTKSRNATVAAASGLSGAPGAERGRLAVVGIGPGRADWRTPEASRLVAESDELVGYGPYLDLLGPAARGKSPRAFGLGEEEARCRHALERAGEGRRVALICSGDGGIYAMGALVMELLGRDPENGGVGAAARRVEIVHAPGISALQAASARAGAMLGHDFCAISLSDLLTRREVVLKRVRAAAEGDFVIAFYNPVSRRRRTLLAEAREILLENRPSDTPVLLASNLGRPGETLRRRTLAALEVDEVDMLTTVIVGASGSRVWISGDISAGAEGGWIYTLRGYSRKMDGELP